MKTFDEAIEEAERVLTAAEQKAESGDTKRSGDLLAVAVQWMSLAYHVENHERRR